MIPLNQVFKDGIDATMIDLWQQCRRKFFNRIIRGLDMREVSTSLAFGKAVHTILEEYLKGALDPTNMPTRFTQIYEDRGLDDRRTTERGIALLKKYFETFPREFEPFEVLAVEKPFTLDIGASTLYSGRVDAVFREKQDKTIWVVDYKTTTAWGDSYIEGYHIHTAVDGYILNAKKTYGSCEGVIIRVLVTSKTTPRIESFRVYRTQEQLDYWTQGTIRVIKDIVDYTQRSYTKTQGIEVSKVPVETKVPKSPETIVPTFLETNPPSPEDYPMSRGRCRDYNSKCMYFDLCRFCDNLSIVDGEFVKRRWTPFNVPE